MSRSESKRHVLVTGGAGFIGSHLCDTMLARGYAVTAVDSLVTGRVSNLDQASQRPDFDFIERDICSDWSDRDFSQISKYGLDGVFHFACPASPIDFDRIPEVILAVDSIGTMKTVDLALQHGARYVLASTSEVYGDPLVHPQREDYWGNVNPIGLRACYDEAKRFAEAYVSTAQRGLCGRKLNAGIVRIFNTYGPRMRPDDGRIVPELCMQALRGESLTLHGDGKQTRSFCYVSDLVDGVIRLFESRESLPVNIGNPIERTVRDFADAVLRLTGGKESQIKHLPARPDDPRRRCPDIERAKCVLGWEPLVDLDTGLSQTLEHFKRAV